MKPYQYIVTVEAYSQDEADTVMGARMGHEEDLTEDGVRDYTIDYKRKDES